MKRFDVVVIGAGPAGATAALLLARAGRSVALIEKKTFPRRKVCGEFISAQAIELLQQTGVGDLALAAAGPEVHEVAVYAGEQIVAGPMPRAEGSWAFGRALARDHLDTLLRDAASGQGAALYQPCRARSVRRMPAGFECEIETGAGDTQTLQASVVIAAHGSWDTGGLGDWTTRGHSPSDLLAFKNYFSEAALPPARMPLLAFPGGYGGLVHADRGRVSFSCCIRRDALSAIRQARPGVTAGAVVLDHVIATCRGVREALSGAQTLQPWLAAGPLHPGIRSGGRDGFFAVGNAKGEAHPVVAEGISMAIQSAWLLCDRLLRESPAAEAAVWSAVAKEYEKAYRLNFAPRIRAAALFAHIAMRPAAAITVASVLKALPPLLAAGARYAGKARALRPMPLSQV